MNRHWHGSIFRRIKKSSKIKLAPTVRYATGILLFGAAEFAVQRVEEPGEELNGVALLPGPVGLLGHDRTRLDERGAIWVRACEVHGMGCEYASACVQCVRRVRVRSVHTCSKGAHKRQKERRSASSTLDIPASRAFSRICFHTFSGRAQSIQKSTRAHLQQLVRADLRFEAARTPHFAHEFAKARDEQRLACGAGRGRGR